jgi:hypothetical protein
LANRSPRTSMQKRSMPSSPAMAVRSSARRNKPFNLGLSLARSWAGYSVELSRLKKHRGSPLFGKTRLICSSTRWRVALTWQSSSA